jgi:hypothetical protein
MDIDCGSCQAFPHACSDCVVSVLLGQPGEQLALPVPRVHVANEHAAALEVLAGGGLIPPLRLVLVDRHVG